MGFFFRVNDEIKNDFSKSINVTDFKEQLSITLLFKYENIRLFIDGLILQYFESNTRHILS